MEKQIVNEPKLSVVEYPNKSILEKSQDVVFDEEFKVWLSDFIYLYANLKTKFGHYMVGLSAPQAGKNLRCFIAEDVVYVNPEIVWKTKAPQTKDHESCLSLPLDKSWPIERHDSITLKYQDREGVWQEKRFNGIHARVIQHEIDHLDGVLCCGQDFPEVNKKND